MFVDATTCRRNLIERVQTVVRGMLPSFGAERNSEEESARGPRYFFRQRFLCFAPEQLRFCYDDNNRGAIPSRLCMEKVSPRNRATNNDREKRDSSNVSDKNDDLQ